ncbi:Zinc finger BED domain-containing protein 1 [Eumeta japonica]|uniref:Zinc finger BED domain-containing protein 1 n=1 Tax=Eumeta variegata TaxID=151549 RepID=A0A4C1Z0V2_EUMVA|nr:Zinc finger BED domain-containing protein 1 [Eumeta japonica]
MLPQDGTVLLHDKQIDRAKGQYLYITDNPSTANLQQLTERQWEILRECITLLKPFEESQDPHASFWNCFEELASTQPLDRDDPKSPIALELDSYLKENLLTKNKSPFEWWTGHQPRYPELARLARVFLCAPASTVYSERLFSEAGNVYEEKRNRLLPERAESLVFPHHNLPLLNT